MLSEEKVAFRIQGMPIFHSGSSFLGLSRRAMHVHKYDRCTSRWMDGWMNGYLDRYEGGHVDRYIYICIYVYIDTDVTIFKYNGHKEDMHVKTRRFPAADASLPIV